MLGLMVVALFFRRRGKQQEGKKSEEEAHYKVTFEEVSPVEYLNRVQKKKDSISAIMKYQDIHNLLEHSSSQGQEEDKGSGTKG